MHFQWVKVKVVKKFHTSGGGLVDMETELISLMNFGNKTLIEHAFQPTWFTM